VTVRIVELMYRGVNREVPNKSQEYTKLQSQTVEFPVEVAAKGEAAVNYAVRYTW